MTTEHSGLHPNTSVRLPVSVFVALLVAFAGAIWAGAAAWFSNRHEVSGLRSQIADLRRGIDNLTSHQQQLAAGFHRRLKAARVECPPRPRRAGVSTMDRCRVVFVEGPEEPDGKGQP
jgi:hypothetical protein